MKIQQSRRRSKYSVRLDASEKQKLRHFIEQIKETVEKSTLPTPKKEAIYKKLNALALEIDKDRTRFEAFADLASDLARVSAEFAREGAEPWWKWIKPIFGLLGDAKDSENQRVGLPAPEERKRLEPPKVETKERPQPDFDSDLDDDVPF